MIENIVDILKTLPGNRTDDQISFLQHNTQQIGLFKSYKEEDGDDKLHKLCCMQMKYEFFSKDKVVFTIDEVGNKFYIILSGKVGVHIRMPKIKIEGEMNQKSISFKDDDEDLKMIKELVTGDSFGELALMKNQKRLASIICLEDCHFGVIDKKIFNIALKEKEIEKLNEEMKFIQSSPIFSQLPKNIIRILHINAFYVRFERNQPVYLEEQFANSCYVIKSGEFTIFKTIDNVHQGYKKKNEYQVSNESTKPIKLKIGLLSTGELFGECEIVRNEKRQQSVFCTSLEGGELMIISKVDLQGRVLCEREYRKMFEKYVEVKTNDLKMRIERITQQLEKYQSFRFSTTASKNQEEGMCEQIRKKSFSIAPEMFDDLISETGISPDFEGDNIKFSPPASKSYSQLSMMSLQVPFQRHSLGNSQQQNQKLNFNTGLNQGERKEKERKSKIGSDPNIFMNSNKSIKVVIDPDGSKQIVNNHEQKPQRNSNEFGGESSSRHIRKQGKEEFLNEALKKTRKGETNEDREKSKSSGRFIQYAPENKVNQQQMRLELDSYTNLKKVIRKKAAVTLSKMYNQPYQKFLSTCSRYDISYSQRQLKLIEKHDTESSNVNQSPIQSKTNFSNFKQAPSSLTLKDSSLSNFEKTLQSKQNQKYQPFSSNPSLCHIPQIKEFTSLQQIIETSHIEDFISMKQEGINRNRTKSDVSPSSDNNKSALFGEFEHDFNTQQKQEGEDNKIESIKIKDENDKNDIKEEELLQDPINIADEIKEFQINVIKQSSQEDENNYELIYTTQKSISKNESLQEANHTHLQKTFSQRSKTKKDTCKAIAETERSKSPPKNQNWLIPLKSASLFFEKSHRNSPKRVERLHHANSYNQSSRPSTVFSSSERYDQKERRLVTSSGLKERPFLQDQFVSLFATTTSFSSQSTRRNKKFTLNDRVKDQGNFKNIQNNIENAALNQQTHQESPLLTSDGFIQVHDNVKYILSKESPNAMIYQTKSSLNSNLSAKIAPSLQMPINFQASSKSPNKRVSNRLNKQLSQEPFQYFPDSPSVYNILAQSSNYFQKKQQEDKSQRDLLISSKSKQQSIVYDIFPPFHPIPTPFTERASSQHQQQRTNSSIQKSKTLMTITKFDDPSLIRSAQQQFVPHLQLKTSKKKSPRNMKATSPIFILKSKQQKILNKEKRSISCLKNSSLSGSFKNLMGSPQYSIFFQK